MTTITFTLNEMYAYLLRLLKMVIKNFPASHATVKEIAQSNILFFIEFIVGGQDNNLIDDHINVNFLPYKTLVDLITQIMNHINSKSHLIVEKSQSMGTTTTVLLTFLWLWLFEKNSHFLIITTNRNQLYRKQNNRSVFKTLLNTLNSIPDFIISNHDYSFKQNRKNHYTATLTNLSTGNTITGLSSGKKRDLVSIIESRQIKAIFLDELAFHRNSDAHWLQIDNKKIPIFAVSSANGQSNLFYELITYTSIDKFNLHWFHNPDKDVKWYNNLIHSFSTIDIEQMFNINYLYKKPPQKKTHTQIDNILPIKTDNQNKPETTPKKAALDLNTSDTTTKNSSKTKTKRQPTLSAVTGGRRNSKNNLSTGPKTVASVPKLLILATRRIKKFINMPHLPLFTYNVPQWQHNYNSLHQLAYKTPPRKINSLTETVKIINKYCPESITDIKITINNSTVTYCAKLEPIQNSKTTITEVDTTNPDPKPGNVIDIFPELKEHYDRKINQLEQKRKQMEFNKYLNWYKSLEPDHMTVEFARNINSQEPDMDITLLLSEIEDPLLRETEYLKFKQKYFNHKGKYPEPLERYTDQTAYYEKLNPKPESKKENPNPPNQPPQKPINKIRTTKWDIIITPKPDNKGPPQK